MKKKTTPYALIAASVLLLAGAGRASASPGEAPDRTQALAQKVLETLGGAEAWQQTRFVRWPNGCASRLPTVRR